MPPKASSNTDRAWADSFGAALKMGKSPQGEGWLTFKEIMQKYRLGSHKAYKVLRQQIKNGLLERFEGYTLQEGRSYRQVWYRPCSLGKRPIGRPEWL